MYSASGDGRIPFLDTRDIAAVAAAVLGGEGHVGETYVLTGPEAISYRQATEIRGRADAEATEIYASAYNQSVQSRSFYEFLRTMEAFEKTIDPNTWLVVSTDSDYFSFLKASGP